jgi:hypothetical protein
VKPQRPRKTDLSEADIQRTCTDLLALDDWRPLETNPCSDRARGKGFGEIGMADYLYLRYSATARACGEAAFAEVLWIEWKRPGKHATPQQQQWHLAERARGALTLVAGYDFGREAKTGNEMIDAFLVWYRGSGFNRKGI